MIVRYINLLSLFSGFQLRFYHLHFFLIQTSVNKLTSHITSCREYLIDRIFNTSL